MNTWGSKLLTAVSTVAEMLALGLDLDQHAFTNLMKFAPHLLAPTGSLFLFLLLLLKWCIHL